MINTIVVSVIGKHGELLDTLVPIKRIIGANENSAGDVWLTYLDDSHGNKRKCRVRESVNEISLQCNGVTYLIHASEKQV
jgi:hypothetical protein